MLRKGLMVVLSSFATVDSCSSCEVDVPLDGLPLLVERTEAYGKVVTYDPRCVFIQDCNQLDTLKQQTSDAIVLALPVLTVIGAKEAYHDMLTELRYGWLRTIFNSTASVNLTIDLADFMFCRLQRLNR